MPAVTRISPGLYQYRCQCGRMMTLDLKADERPTRLVRCFECVKKSVDWDIIRELLTEKFDTPLED